MLHSIRRTLRLVLGLAVIVTAGCSNDDSETNGSAENAPPFAGAHVRILVPKSAADSAAWDLFLNEWSALSGATVAVETWDEVDDAERTLKLQTNDGAVVFFPMTARAELAARDLFSPLPPDLQSPDTFDWPDIYHGLSDNVLKWDGQPAFLPIQQPLLLLYYRRDLLDSAGLQPPESWSEYRELLESLDQWAPGLTAVEPWGESSRVSLILARSLSLAKLEGNYSVFWDYMTGEPLIGSAGFVRGLEQSLADRELLDPLSNNMSPDDCLESIAEGKSAIAIASAFPPVDREFGPADRDATWEIGVLPLPGSERVFDPARQFWVDSPDKIVNRATLTGWNGTLVGVAATGDETARRAAWNLLQSLTREFVADAFPPGRLTPSRLSTSNQPYPLSVAGLDVRSHSDAVRMALRDTAVVPELSILNRELFRSVLQDQFDRAAAGEVTADDALQAAAASWNKLFKEHDPEKLRQSYARGLGIPLH